MKPEQTLNWRRLGLLCRKEIIEPWKTHVLRVVLMYAALAVILTWHGLIEYPTHCGYYYTTFEEFSSMLFWAGLFVLGLASASFVMERMKRKTGRIHVLTLPASPAEKYLVRWLLFTVGFLVAYIVAFYLAEWTKVVICRLRYAGLAEFIRPYGVGTCIDRVAGNDTWNLSLLFSIYLFVQSFFVLGSSIWPKNAFLKTVAALVAVGLTYLVAATTSNMLSHTEISYNYYYSKPSIWQDQDFQYGFGTIVFCLLAVFNWVLAYYRFKESEVINRW